MKKIIASVLLLSLLLTALSGCQPAPQSSAVGSTASESTAPAAGKPALPTQDIAILHTNDVHGAVDSEIGYAGIAAYRKQLQTEGTAVLLVDCGDAIQGTPAGALSQGADILALMNQLGYDAAIPGNHEFDYGMEQFLSLAKQAKFPYLSANFTDEKAGKTVFPPYLIKETAGVKIAFVGVTTPLTITSSTPAYFQDGAGNFIYGFLGDETGAKLYAAVQTAVDGARAEGADYVIALTHLGVGSVTSPYLSTALIENTTGIDAVLDGHSHSTVESERVKNKDGQRVLLSQTGTGLTALGMLLIDQRGNLSTGFVSNITEQDPEMTAAVAQINAKFETMLAEQVAVTENVLTVNDPATGVRIIRNAETNLGDLCADAYLAAGKTDVAFVNGGGIRADLPLGNITYGDILKVFPYGNGLCTMSVTGQELLDALEHGVRQMPEESGAFLHVAGMAFEIDPTIPTPVVTDDKGMFQKIEGARRVQNVTVGGQPLDPARSYTLTSHGYLLKNGGDGFNMFADNAVTQDDFMLDYTALINYLRDEYPAQAKSYDDPYGMGRIVAAGQK